MVAVLLGRVLRVQLFIDHILEGCP
jgi:hypothetical protein